MGLVALPSALYNAGTDYFSLAFLFFVLVCTIYQLCRIYPYTVLSSPQILISEEENTANDVSILIANVLMTNRNSAKCIDLIKKQVPDIILGLECDAWWQSELKIIEKDYPYKVHIPLPNTYGMLLYSRLKILNQQISYLIENEVPSIHCTIELRSRDKIIFHGVHPKPPAPQESKTSVPRDAELISVAKICKEARLPCIVAGDLNDMAWSHTTHLFQRISGLLDPHIGRGMYSTYHSKYFFLRWPLDHVFISRHFKLIEMLRLPSIDSDHFPIYAKFSYEPHKKHENDKIEPSHQDQKEAHKKLAKA